MTTEQTTETPLDYEGGQPHDSEALVAALRERLAVPTEWINMQHTGGGTMCLSIALDMHIEDVGDPENGPKISAYPNRWALVTCDSPKGEEWIVGFYSDAEVEHPQHEEDEGVCVTLRILAVEPSAERVAEEVVGLLVRATSLKRRSTPLSEEATI